MRHRQRVVVEGVAAPGEEGSPSTLAEEQGGFGVQRTGLQVKKPVARTSGTRDSVRSFASSTAVGKFRTLGRASSKACRALLKTMQPKVASTVARQTGAG